MLSLLIFFAATTVNLDVVTVPLSGDVRVVLTPAARAEIRREGTVTRVKIDVDRIGLPATLGAVLNTYVVWAVSPEGLLDNLGELEVRSGKAQFAATTRLTQFGVLITAEPHYMVDRPSSAVAFRSQTPETDIRRKTVPVEVGVYDYSQLKPVSAVAVPHGSVIQARYAFQIAQSAGADRLAPSDFRNAQVAIGAMEELVKRVATLDILWSSANEAIRWSQRAAANARGKN
jgi:hypothetical protein